MTFHVLIPDSVDPSAVDLLKQHDEIQVTAPGNLNRDETIAALPGAQAMIIRSSTKADRELLEKAPDLKVIARAGVGVDNVDLDYATERGIIVMNTPAGNTIATAEHTFALMLALARHVPEAYLSMREGRWDRKLYEGTELRGKTLGVVGFGRIGKAVAARALAFEMTVVAADPFVDGDAMRELGVEKVELDDLYAQADYITLHTIITDETREMICASAFGKMKKGVRIVNAARGALINDEDLRDALESGIVAGVAMDVYQVEPPPAEHPLVAHANVIHTPHLAASTVEAQVAVAVEAAELVIGALKRGEYANVVNRSVLEKL
jgi:D-3-phosphoglycerate dehydrogenase / 2-oxoglutarate reductase